MAGPVLMEAPGIYGSPGRCGGLFSVMQDLPRLHFCMHEACYEMSMASERRKILCYATKLYLGAATDNL